MHIRIKETIKVNPWEELATLKTGSKGEEHRFVSLGYNLSGVLCLYHVSQLSILTDLELLVLPENKWI